MTKTSAQLKSRLRRRLAPLLLAVATCPAAFAQQPMNFEQAQQLFNQGRYAEAIEALSNLTAVAPERSQALLYLGKALSKLERFGEAEDALRRYAASEGAAGDGVYLLAYVLFRQGRAPVARPLSTGRQTPSAGVRRFEDYRPRLRLARRL